MADALDTTKLRAELEAERDRIREQIRDLSDDVSFDEGFADTSQVTAERGEIEVLSGTLGETLADIEDALEKFAAGTYGACASCGEAIAPARLEAMPMARCCITCASAKR